MLIGPSYQSTQRCYHDSPYAKGFIFGELTVADLALASPFVNARYAQYTVDAAKWPKFAGLFERVTTHGAVAPLLEAEAKAFGG